MRKSPTELEQDGQNEDKLVGLGDKRMLIKLISKFHRTVGVHTFRITKWTRAICLGYYGLLLGCLIFLS